MWVPLVPQASASASKPTTSPEAPISSGQDKQDEGRRPEKYTSSTTLHRTQPRQPTGLADRKDTPSTPGANSIDKIQRKLETKVCLKKNLIDRPIDQFWRGFLVNLGRELWRLDLNIRVGLSLVLVGFTFNSISFVTWFLWSPRLVFLAMLILVPLVYLDPFDVKPQFEAIGNILVSPGQIVEAAEHLKPGQLRRLCLVLLMYPTALEIYTISFLTNVQVEPGWEFFTLLIVGFNLVFMMFLLKLRHWTPRDCLHKGLLILYGSALLIVMAKMDMRQISRVAGPFCSATGTLLLTYRDDDMEWMSRTIRFALRLTLRDVLASISAKVNEDEMLQLAMLRWIVDYWAYIPPASQTTPPPPQRRKSSDDLDEFATNESTQSNSTSTREDFPTSANQPASPRHQDVPWQELQPMLNMATDQMAEEVYLLQSRYPTDGTEGTATESSSSTSPLGATRSSSSSFPAHCDDGNDSLRNLKAMLITLDVDERGRPAVMAYKRAVEAFPPTQKLAMFMSVARRCPALLTLMVHYAIGSPALAMRVIVLLPFMILEYFRIEAWKAACARLADLELAVTDEGRAVSEQLLNIDAMTLLLSGDHDYSFRPPTLLLVWRNIVSSVAALEVGLTATRCLQTTTVAVQFAGNIMSLAQLGYEISQFGLFHGLGVMAKEVIFMHTAEPSSEHDRAQNMRYAGAAMNAIENGKFVLRNIEIILQDEHLKPVLGQVVGCLTALSGHGWLGGKQGPTSGDEASVGQEAQLNASRNEETSTKDTEPQDSHTTERRRRSVRFSDDEIGDSIEQVGDKALSSVMELLSQAHEQGCIDHVS
jgi:hypothetical protein